MNKGVPHTSETRQRRLVVASIFIGSAIEWYDYFIFGIVSALYLNKLFFPSFDPNTGKLLGFMVFATAWLVRPIGGIVAGHLGDRIGRKTTLFWSFIIMGGATTMIGLLPTYKTAGGLGALLLVALRVLQGLSAGAEYGGGIVAVVEQAKQSKRGFYGSMPQSGAFLGLLLGNATFLLMTNNLNQEAFMEWGWRIPFLISAAMLMVGLFIRKRMPESPDFVKAKAQGAIERLPFLAVVRNYPKQVFSVIFATAASNSYFYAYAVVMVSYAVSTLGMSQSKMLSAVCVAAAVEMCTIPVFGLLSDRVGRRKVFVGGLMVLMLVTPLFCMAAEAKSYGWMLVGYVVLLGIGHAAAHASQASLFSDMFPTSVRYTGLSVSYQTSTAIFSGPLPIVATVLIAAQGGGLRLFFGYTVLIGLLSLVAIMKGKPHYTLLSTPEVRRDKQGSVKASL